MIVTIHQASGRRVVAICDDDLLGKQFEEGEKILDLSADFYKGEQKSEEETIKIMKTETNLNLVGEQTIKLALKEEIITKDNVRTIKDIPYAQAAVIRE